MMRRILLVDGYNVLYAWKGAPLGRLEDARDELIHRLSDYAGYTGQQVVLVFDAWQSDRLTRTSQRSGALTVVFTKRGETADHYIERLCDGYAPAIDAGRLEVRVATSDGVEQTVILARGATRLPARELILEMEHMRKAPKSAPVPRKTPLMEHLPAEVRLKLERMRRGE
jgi:predicted RNA-binding protein with PIN domain